MPRGGDGRLEKKPDVDWKCLDDMPLRDGPLLSTAFPLGPEFLPYKM